MAHATSLEEISLGSKEAQSQAQHEAAERAAIARERARRDRAAANQAAALAGHDAEAWSAHAEQLKQQRDMLLAKRQKEREQRERDSANSANSCDTQQGCRDVGREASSVLHDFLTHGPAGHGEGVAEGSCAGAISGTEEGADTKATRNSCVGISRSSLAVPAFPEHQQWQDDPDAQGYAADEAGQHTLEGLDAQSTRHQCQAHIALPTAAKRLRNTPDRPVAGWQGGGGARVNPHLLTTPMHRELHFGAPARYSACGGGLHALNCLRLRLDVAISSSRFLRTPSQIGHRYVPADH